MNYNQQYFIAALSHQAGSLSILSYQPNHIFVVHKLDLLLNSSSPFFVKYYDKKLWVLKGTQRMVRIDLEVGGFNTYPNSEKMA